MRPVLWLRQRKNTLRERIIRCPCHRRLQDSPCMTGGRPLRHCEHNVKGTRSLSNIDLVVFVFTCVLRNSVGEVLGDLCAKVLYRTRQLPYEVGTARCCWPNALERSIEDSFNPSLVSCLIQVLEDTLQFSVAENFLRNCATEIYSKKIGNTYSLSSGGRVK